MARIRLLDTKILFYLDGKQYAWAPGGDASVHEPLQAEISLSLNRAFISPQETGYKYVRVWAP
jgi:hypothetical protein